MASSDPLSPVAPTSSPSSPSSAPPLSAPSPSPQPPQASPPQTRPWLARGSRKRRIVLATLTVYLVAGIVFAALCRPRAAGAAHPIQSLRPSRRRVASRAAGPGPRPAPVRAEQRLRRLQGQDVHQLPALPCPPDAAVREALGIAGELPRRSVRGVARVGSRPAVLLSGPRKNSGHTGRSPRSGLENAVLALLFAFGSVYFFTAVEGTVWISPRWSSPSLSRRFYVLFGARRRVDRCWPASCSRFAYLTRPPMLLDRAALSRSKRPARLVQGRPSEHDAGSPKARRGSADAPRRRPPRPRPALRRVQRCRSSAPSAVNSWMNHLDPLPPFSPLRSRPRAT